MLRQRSPVASTALPRSIDRRAIRRWESVDEDEGIPYPRPRVGIRLPTGTWSVNRPHGKMLPLTRANRASPGLKTLTEFPHREYLSFDCSKSPLELLLWIIERFQLKPFAKTCTVHLYLGKTLREIKIH